jgi:hypothetical protein
MYKLDLAVLNAHVELTAMPNPSVKRTAQSCALGSLTTCGGSAAAYVKR